MCNAALSGACCCPHAAGVTALPWHLVNLQALLINSPGLHTLCLNHTGETRVRGVTSHRNAATLSDAIVNGQRARACRVDKWQSQSAVQAAHEQRSRPVLE